MNSRQERIQLLSRINRWKAAAPAFVARFSEAIGESIDADALLSPAATDEVIDWFNDSYQNAIKPDEVVYRRSFRSGERDLVFRIADCMANSLPNERVFFVTRLCHDRVAVRTSISALLSHTASILRLDGDSVSALSEKRNDGILIDQNLGDPEAIYDMVVWGERWPLLALNCDTK